MAVLIGPFVRGAMRVIPSKLAPLSHLPVASSLPAPTAPFLFGFFDLSAGMDFRLPFPGDAVFVNLIPSGVLASYNSKVYRWTDGQLTDLGDAAYPIVVRGRFALLGDMDHYSDGRSRLDTLSGSRLAIPSNVISVVMAPDDGTLLFNFHTATPQAIQSYTDGIGFQTVYSCGVPSCRYAILNAIATSGLEHLFSVWAAGDPPPIVSGTYLANEDGSFRMRVSAPFAGGGFRDGYFWYTNDGGGITRVHYYSDFEQITTPSRVVEVRMGDGGQLALRSSTGLSYFSRPGSPPVLWPRPGRVFAGGNSYDFL